MLQLHDLVRADNTVSEIVEKYPETGPVFQKFQVRVSCYDCPIRHAARKSGIELEDLLVGVNEAIYRGRGITD
jgi:iron-sulfur cluster repair protein YtfE (RIC family)